MIIHVVFQVLVLLLGLGLMISSLLFDIQLKKNCPELYSDVNNADSLTKIQEFNRIILAIGTLMISVTGTIMTYSFMTANILKSKINHPKYITLMVYLLFLFIVGLTVFIVSFMISGKIKNCTNNSAVKSSLRGMKTIGGFTWGLSLVLIILLILRVKGKGPWQKSKKWSDRTTIIDEKKKAILSVEKETEIDKLKKTIQEKREKVKAEKVKAEKVKEEIQKKMEKEKQRIEFNKEKKKEIIERIQRFKRSNRGIDKNMIDILNEIEKNECNGDSITCKDYDIKSILNKFQNQIDTKQNIIDTIEAEKNRIRRVNLRNRVVSRVPKPKRKNRIQTPKIGVKNVPKVYVGPRRKK